MNLDDKQSKGTHWISLFFDRNKAVYLILLGLNSFINKSYAKSMINPSFTT